MSSSAPIVDRIRIIPRPNDFLDRNVGSSGQVYFNRDSSSLRVYNGVIAGGFEIARADLNNISNTNFLAKATAAGIGGAGGVEWDNVNNKPTFAIVATSGLYTDLLSIPSIPSDISDLTDNSNLLAGVGGVSADPEYNNGAIIDLVGDGSNFFSREVTTNGVRIVAAGAVGGQTAVPDAFVEKVARMFELFTDVNGAGINETSQRTFIKTLSGDAGTYHAGLPTLQRVARGAGADYSPNFLTDQGIIDWNLTPLFDATVQNDMVWYLNSTGGAPGNGDGDAQEVIEHVFHTLHMHGLDAATLKMYPFISADWASGPLYNAMVEAYDASMWDPSGYNTPSNAFKTDPDAFEVAAKEYLYLLNFGMFEYYTLWDGNSLSPEWNDVMRTPAGILANNPLGYALHNSYIATVISKPSLTTIRSIFQDGDVGDPTVAGASGYVVDVVSSGGNLVVSEFSFAIAADDSTQRLISNGETVQIIGGTGITTASDAEGNITITAAAASTTFATLTDASTASLTIDKIYEPAIAMLRVDNVGTSAYTFNSHYAGNNPTIYALAGTTIAFDLSAVPGHPFQIQDSAGDPYNTGLVHVSTTGVVSIGAAAQDKSTGTLYWRIPESIFGTYRYQCQSHVAMVGGITIKRLSVI